MYKHVLVAVDLSNNSQALVNRGVEIARRHEAKLSLIHVDVSFSDLYTGLNDVNTVSIQDKIYSETQESLIELEKSIDYPIFEKLNGSGDLSAVLIDAIKKYDVDLLLVGHHQDFISKFMSSTKQLINNINIDMLVMPIKK